MDHVENEPFTNHVYIGFSPKDEKAINILKSQLGKNDICFCCREIRNGVQSSIKEGVKTSRKCLLFLTKDYFDDQWCNMETATVLGKVDTFGRDTLIVIKGKSLVEIPREFQGFRETTLTIEDLSNKDKIACLVNDIKIEPIMMLKYGPAASYFYGYLNLILQDFRQRITELVKLHNWLPSTMKKMLIIVPESCICPTSMSEDGKIEFTDQFVFLAGNRAGNQKRDYKNSLYRVKEGESDYYFAGEFATPLLTLYETYRAQVCNMTPDNLFVERDVFYYTLKGLLSHPDNVGCDNQYKLVYWSDPKTKKPNRLGLHQFLLSVIKRELDLERNDEPSKKIKETPRRSNRQQSLFEVTPGGFGIYEGIATYPLNSRPRGKCLIINIIDFTKNVLTKREGAEMDTAILTQLFQDLHFEVQIHENLDKDTLETLLITTNKTDHSAYDAFVCCILSHGNLGGVFTCDEVLVEILDIVEFFADKQCPSLKGKPKMFFVQACQSGSREVPLSSQDSCASDLASRVATRCTVAGENAETCVEIDASPAIQPQLPGSSNRAVLVPSYPDFLMSYSTLPGSAAFRHKKIGSFYIKALNECLREDLEIDRALKQVTTKVREDLAKQEEEDRRQGLPSEEPYAQLPFHLTSAMERLLYLAH